MLVTLGRVIVGSQSNDCLGIGASTPAGRSRVIDYIERAIELAAHEANWQILIGTLDICSNRHGIITLPPFVGTVLATNVCGQPTIFRNSWYEFHITGLGSNDRKCGAGCGWGYVDDLLWTPTFDDIETWSCVAAICEDAVDGSSGLNLIVQGETMDKYGNQKAALTIPVAGPSSPGVLVPIINGYAATDPGMTMFKNITQVTKPVTRGYVKLIAFDPTQNGVNGATIGYYGPNETNPRYRRIRTHEKCRWARVRYRRAEMPFTDDSEILPIASYTAMLDLLRVVRYRETNRGDDADKALGRVIDLLGKIESIENGPGIAPIQVEPGSSVSIGTIDFR